MTGRIAALGVLVLLAAEAARAQALPTVEKEQTWGRAVARAAGEDARLVTADVEARLTVTPLKSLRLELDSWIVRRSMYEDGRLLERDLAIPPSLFDDERCLLLQARGNQTVLVEGPLEDVTRGLRVLAAAWTVLPHASRIDATVVVLPDGGYAAHTWWRKGALRTRLEADLAEVRAIVAANAAAGVSEPAGCAVRDFQFVAELRSGKTGPASGLRVRPDLLLVARLLVRALGAPPAVERAPGDPAGRPFKGF